MSDFETLLISINDQGIATLTINRPDKLNALNNQVLDEMDEALDQLSENESVKGIIVTGAGEKAFVAGADIKELSSLDRKTGIEQSKRGQGLFNRLETSDKPVIAVVNGYALGGGTELALACHIRIGTPSAVFGLPEVGLGLIPGYGGTQRLTQLVGKARSMELILTGRHIKADEALSIGLINSLSENAMEDAQALLGKMLKNGPVALAKAIAAVNALYGKDGYSEEANLFGDLCETEDFVEGTSAFIEKRKAEFKGK
jgi:enoyl-CoA hydratase